jgi:NADP-dependent alcohol dehydrogenase
MQIKTRLSEYDLGNHSGEQAVEAIIKQLTRHGMTQLGEKQLITLEKSRAILLASL